MEFGSPGSVTLALFQTSLAPPAAEEEEGSRHNCNPEEEEEEEEEEELVSLPDKRYTLKTHAR